jgi:hypothetical protein
MGYLIKSYLDDHPELIDRLKRLRSFGLIFKLLSQIWAFLSGLAQSGLELLPKIARKSEKEAGPTSGANRWNWFGLRNQSPRHRIVYYYLSLLKHAEKEGLARQDHQTPYEYEPDLAESAPTVQSEIRDVTDIFVQARYSADQFANDRVSVVKRQWQQIRKALRRKREARPSRKR